MIVKTSAQESAPVSPMPTDGKGDGGLRKAQASLMDELTEADELIESAATSDATPFERFVAEALCSQDAHDQGLVERVWVVYLPDARTAIQAINAWNARAPSALTEAAKPGGELREARQDGLDLAKAFLAWNKTLIVAPRGIEHLYGMAVDIVAAEALTAPPREEEERPPRKLRDAEARQNPCDLYPPAPTSPKDAGALEALRRAVEFGGYLANSADGMLNSLNNDAPDGDARADSWNHLKSAVYEFRKRAAKALAEVEGERS